MKKIFSYCLLTMTIFLFSCSQKINNTPEGSESKSTLITTVLITCLVMAIPLLLMYATRKKQQNNKK